MSNLHLTSRFIGDDSSDDKFNIAQLTMYQNSMYCFYLFVSFFQQIHTNRADVAAKYVRVFRQVLQGPNGIPIDPVEVGEGIGG